MIRSFSLFFISMPLLFGLLRASTTGTDFRYVWVAAASLIGAGACTAVLRERMRQLRTAVAVSSGAFLLAALCAVVAAMFMGTRFGMGLLVVASSFAFCSAVGCLLFAITRR